jgi:hypothetical protein
VGRTDGSLVSNGLLKEGSASSSDRLYMTVLVECYTCVSLLAQPGNATGPALHFLSCTPPPPSPPTVNRFMTISIHNPACQLHYSQKAVWPCSAHAAQCDQYNGIRGHDGIYGVVNFRILAILQPVNACACQKQKWLLSAPRPRGTLARHSTQNTQNTIRFLHVFLFR